MAFTSGGDKTRDRDCRVQHIRFEKKINCTSDQAFQVSTDYEKLPETTGGFYTSVRVRSRREGTTLAEHRIHLMDYTLVTMIKHATSAPLVHTSYWVGGNAKGSVITETYAKSGTQTVLSVEAKLKLPVKLAIKSALYSKKLESELRQMAHALAQTAES